MKTKVVIQTNGLNTKTRRTQEKLSDEKTRKKRKLDENNEKINEEDLSSDDRTSSSDHQTTINNKSYYKCTRCDIKYDTQIELKAHYYDEHIDNEHKPSDLCTEAIVDHKEEDNEPLSVTCTTPNDTNLDEKLENDEETSSKKRKLDKKEANNDKTVAEKSQKSEKNDVDLSRMSDDEIIEFNFDHIDEKELIENINKQKYDKKNDLLAGRVGWAQWRKTMWPAIIEKVIANKTVLTVYIRYYEGERLGKKFKLDSSKVELFYKCKEHTKYKVLAALDKPGRKKFFIAYTNALNDYIKYNLNEDKTKQEEKNNNNNSNNNKNNDSSTTNDNKKEFSSNGSKPTKEKYFILGKQMSIDEIRACANGEYSEEQLAENKRRVEYSNELLDFIVTSANLKDYLMGIMKSEVDCKRHRDYLKMNARDRRKSIVNSLGPLIEDDQVKLGTYLRELCDSNYVDKPVHLDKYYFDVLYPEAVIWGLKKIHNISYKEADKKLKQGFKQTNEEITKRKCKDIVSKLSVSNGQNENNQNNNSNTNQDDSNSFVDPQFNEDDTSFFAYQQQTDENVHPNGVGKDDQASAADKRLSDSLPQLIN